MRNAFASAVLAAGVLCAVMLPALAGSSGYVGYYWSDTYPGWAAEAFEGGK